MSCDDELDVWYKGETREWVLSVSSDGVPKDLTGASVELQIKTRPGAADPPLVSLSLGGGITLRAQSGADLGKADVVLAYDALMSLTAGIYYVSVVVIYPSVPINRKIVVKPYAIDIRDDVNPP